MLIVVRCCFPLLFASLPSASSALASYTINDIYELSSNSHLGKQRYLRDTQ